MADEINNQDVAEPQDNQPDNGAESSEETKMFPAEYVQELRAEAAKWRTQLRDLEKKVNLYETESAKKQEQELAENAKWQELAEKRAAQLEALQAQVKAQEIQQIKMATLNELGLPQDAMDFLTGDTAEAIKEQAEKFKSLIPESQARSQNPRQTKSMTVIPGGEPSTETREQKLKRLYGNGNIFG